MYWVIDGNNVMGAGADGWWNDPPRAAARLTQLVAVWCRGHDEDVVVVFDGPEVPAVLELAGGNLAVMFAGSTRRDAADDVIVEHTSEVYSMHPELLVVTSDKGLVGRLPPGVETMGAGRYRALIGL